MVKDRFFMKIYVHYLARTVTEDDVHNAFSPYGDISSVGLLTVPPNDDPLGVCYAEMAREDHFSAVLENVDQISIGGFPVRLDEPRCAIGRRTGVDRRGDSRQAGPERRQTDRRAIPRLIA